MQGPSKNDTKNLQPKKAGNDLPMLHKDLVKRMARAGYEKMTRWSQPVPAVSK